MSKAFLLVVISLVTIMMITAGSFHLVLADPLLCDIEGWPSCYSVGYSHGLANPGTSCPSGHSDNYCAGWDAGARMENTQDNNPSPQPTLPEGCGPGYDNYTCDNNPSPQPTLLEGSSSGLNYSAICQTLQRVPIPPCDTLVNDDGSLASNGTHAMECIRNRIALVGGATFLLHLPLPLVRQGLSMLATPTGCNGIVDMSKFDLLSHIGSLSSILNFLS